MVLYNLYLDNIGIDYYNLGTGHGYSVLEVLKSFEKVVGRPIKYEIKDRRPGDIATCYADTKKAKEELGFVATRGIEEMCEDAWRWQQKNPNGFNR